ncbi:predicted protein [Phaeodactylum tricornutum CCAP 1055/1]|uniref:Uncharacterized protein n=3 Tax=Phaeodactylum tricornutum TaxID=2850 RepID=B7FX57_PHATC|nr:predicted protein [Phaeodactylum tricornutum CCAP 1055/1]EEC49319.1 predicted protein [Phaeodactylum tricornutum CCAP 1055/1]|eukprot:XP_002179496.1 predicted protein [Phaeodactylum tricornutum CCAP 1055/1]
MTAAKCRDDVTNEFHPFQEATIGVSFLSKTVICIDTNKAIKLKIWDTAGQERYQSLTPLYFRGAGAAILVYDICRRHSKHLAIPDNRSVSEEEAREFSRSISAYYTETSARNNQNIAELFQELARQSAATLVNEDSLTVNDNTVDFSASEVPKKTCCL